MKQFFFSLALVATSLVWVACATGDQAASDKTSCRRDSVFHPSDPNISARLCNGKVEFLITQTAGSLDAGEYQLITETDSVTNIFLADIGQDTNPVLCMSTADGGVEILCLYADPSASIESRYVTSGKLPGFEGIVDFRSGLSPDSSYQTIYALGADSTETEIHLLPQMPVWEAVANWIGEAQDEYYRIVFLPDWKIDYMNGWYMSDINERFVGRVRKMEESSEQSSEVFSYQMVIRMFFDVPGEHFITSSSAECGEIRLDYDVFEQCMLYNRKGNISFGNRGGSPLRYHLFGYFDEQMMLATYPPLSRKLVDRYNLSWPNLLGTYKRVSPIDSTDDKQLMVCCVGGAVLLDMALLTRELNSVYEFWATELCPIDMQELFLTENNVVSGRTRSFSGMSASIDSYWENAEGEASLTKLENGNLVVQTIVDGEVSIEEYEPAYSAELHNDALYYLGESPENKGFFVGDWVYTDDDCSIYMQFGASGEFFYAAKRRNQPLKVRIGACKMFIYNEDTNAPGLDLTVETLGGGTRPSNFTLTWSQEGDEVVFGDLSADEEFFPRGQKGVRFARAPKEWTFPKEFWK